jgi:prepilin-type N-terminal cleavage/methylation domain-containing protein
MHVSFVGRRRKSQGRWPGFTLVELLVVIGAISVLIAILFPTIHSVREQARGVACTNHLRTLWQGYVLFAADHDGRLPGNANDYALPDPDAHDWLARSGKRWTVDTLNTAPQEGTLFRYVNRDYRIYRCPSLEPAPSGSYEEGGGGGSNGRWDYVAFTIFAGCHLHRIPNTCTFSDNGTVLTLPTPIICEEDGGTINGVNMEGCHAESDQLGHQHRGGSYYASPDGSVNWFSEPMDAGAGNWWVAGPTGAPCNMGHVCNSGYFELHGKNGFPEFGP